MAFTENTNTAEIKSTGVSVNVEQIRRDFPILHQLVHGKPLAYLDNAATTQKPQQVIDKIAEYYSEYNSNVHRGVHYLSQKATDEYERTRKVVKDFINASSEKEIIFTSGTTDGINLVAQTYGRKNLYKGDEVIISAMEHHSNIVPWQLICEEKEAVLKVAPINDDGELIFQELKNLISEKTKIISLVHISNSLGTINPVKEVIELAHQHNIVVLIDGAQAVAHIPVDVQELDCDFYAFSGHKIFGPTGIGILYGKKELLDNMPPYKGGGDMIKSVTFEKTLFADLPHKFEAGTPHIEGVIGLGTALDYINKVGFEYIENHEQELLEYATGRLSEIEEVRLIGTAAEKASVLSFVIEDIHPHDVGTMVDREGVAIRTGHHCTQPVMHRFNVPATSRASFSIYNTTEEADQLAEAIKKTIKMFK